MRTAIVLPSGCVFSPDRPNSMETVVRTLATFCAEPENQAIFCDQGDDVPSDLGVHTYPSVRPRRRHADQTIAALRDWKPDLIEVHQHGPTAARIARAFPDIATVLYRHNYSPAPKGPLERLRYEHRLAPLTGSIFVSEAARTDFATHYPRFANRAHALPNPIDGAAWFASPEHRDPVIAFAGRATEEKGLHLLCEALPTVLDRYSDWSATLVLGDWEQHGSTATRYLSGLQRFGDRVRVLKSQPLSVVRDTLKRAAIVVVPSVWAEPLGLAALEGHAAGAAVVSSGRGGLREASGPHAIYVEPLTATGLAEAMSGLIDDPERRLKMARSGQTFVQTVHSPVHRARELDALRRRLVGQAALRSV